MVESAGKRATEQGCDRTRFEGRNRDKPRNTRTTLKGSTNVEQNEGGNGFTLRRSDFALQKWFHALSTLQRGVGNL